MTKLYYAYENTPLNTQTLSSDDLNISQKITTNPLPWNGQFSPQLVQILLENYANKNDVLYDPFLGSGTTLLESGKFGISAMGTEINSAAVFLSNIYTFINIGVQERNFVLTKLENKLISDGFIFQDSLFGIPTQIDFESFKKLAICKFSIEEKIIVDAFIILCDIYKGNFSQKWISAKWTKLKTLILSLPYSNKNIKVINEDARHNQIKSNTATFVLTSPPYINVFNYHQQYRASAELLGGSVLPAAQAEIGSNRKNRSNRFNTVTQYCIDMGMVFSEINRICTNNSEVIFVVGRESSVMKTPFYNGKIVAQVATEICGLGLTSRQERSFKNKFGNLIYEDILHFKSTKKTSVDIIAKTRCFGKKILEETRQSVNSDFVFDLNSAIENAEKIEVSKFLSRRNIENAKFA